MAHVHSKVTETLILTCSTLARIIHSFRQVVNFFSSEKLYAISLLAYLPVRGLLYLVLSDAILLSALIFVFPPNAAVDLASLWQMSKRGPRFSRTCSPCSFVDHILYNLWKPCYSYNSIKSLIVPRLSLLFCNFEREHDQSQNSSLTGNSHDMKLYIA